MSQAADSTQTNYGTLQELLLTSFYVIGKLCEMPTILTCICDIWGSNDGQILNIKNQACSC